MAQNSRRRKNSRAVVDEEEGLECPLPPPLSLHGRAAGPSYEADEGRNGRGHRPPLKTTSEHRTYLFAYRIACVVALAVFGLRQVRLALALMRMRGGGGPASEDWDDAVASSLPRTLARFAAGGPFASSSARGDAAEEGGGTVAACLLVLDDTVKLAEWIAYHYTVLPLGHLVVAIDPNSRLAPNILYVLRSWREMGVNITVWQDDVWMDGEQREELERLAKLDAELDGEVLARKREQRAYKMHKLRQTTFVSSCMQELKRRNQTWTLLTDSDEFLVFNYWHPDEILIYDDYPVRKAAIRRRSKAEIERFRRKHMPLRHDLPPLGAGSVSRFLAEHGRDLPRCMFLPGLFVGADESPADRVSADVPDAVDAMNLMTLRYRKHGRRTNHFSKAMINLARTQAWMLEHQYAHTIHNPSVKACGPNGNHASGTDYLSSVFRLNHYLGSPEAYLERSGDTRRDRSLERYYEKNGKDDNPVRDDDDIRPWVSAFVEEVGVQKSKKLLGYLDYVYSSDP